MTLLYKDDRFLLHDTGQHPENIERLKSVYAALEAQRLLEQVTLQKFNTAEDQDLRRVHSAEHLTNIRRFAASGGGRIEVDTVMSAKSAEVAQLACGAAIDAVRSVVATKDTNALCLIRPPGHHALPDAPMGFCLFNSAAVAAKTAVQQLGLKRVLIVDWDVHHGNGTQDAFYEDEHVWFFSAHRFPFYPGTGRRSETGRGQGLGSTFNLPLEYGIRRREYLSAFEQVLTTAADACRPELIVLSAGFDAHTADPVGSLSLETEDFETMTQLLLQVAATHASGRLVSLLEGGYHIQQLADCVSIHLKTLIAGSAKTPEKTRSQIP